MRVLDTSLGIFSLLLSSPTSLFEGVALAHSLCQEGCLLSRVIDREADITMKNFDPDSTQRQLRPQGSVDVVLRSVAPQDIA